MQRQKKTSTILNKPPPEPATTNDLSTQIYGNRGVYLANSLVSADKIKSNPSFSLDKMSTRTIEIAKSGLLGPQRRRQMVKFPPLRNSTINPEQSQPLSPTKTTKSKQMSKTYYQSNLYRCLKKHQTTYIMSLYRQHFFQCIQVLRFGKSIKITHPRKQINLPKKSPHKKTVYLDMDETLIHCDEHSQQYTVKLNFPLERGGTLAAGVRVRPYCIEFLQQLSEFAQIIIFTASAASYADVVLDHLDPDKKYISHRLYRQHCTLQKGFYLKDLRVINRNLEDVVLVDNSPYCHILQPDNGVPIIPFYHSPKDRQLESLLPFLRKIVGAEDCRTVVRNTFFWDKYINEAVQPRKLFLKQYGKE